MTKPDGLTVATRLAQSLDRSAYEAAGAVLHPDCTYLVRGEEIAGREKVLDSYRKNDGWAEEHLDGISYESSVAELGPGRFRVEYVDHLRAGEERHTFRCAQLLTVENGLVVHIEHVDDEKEMAGLAAFWKRAGIER